MYVFMNAINCICDKAIIFFLIVQIKIVFFEIQKRSQSKRLFLETSQEDFEYHKFEWGS